LKTESSEERAMKGFVPIADTSWQIFLAGDLRCTATVIQEGFAQCITAVLVRLAGILCLMAHYFA